MVGHKGQSDVGMDRPMGMVPRRGATQMSPINSLSCPTFA